MISQETCQEWFDSNNRRETIYKDAFLCAGFAEGGRDSCQGDSGGPLIGIAEKYSNRIDKRYSWIGIVSFGVGCAEPGYPGAYTRSSCYLGFVAQQFGLKADFTPPGSHSSWSTDCQNGASRRSSLVHRFENKLGFNPDPDKPVSPANTTWGHIYGSTTGGRSPRLPVQPHGRSFV